jgi:hypothetical protein
MKYSTANVKNSDYTENHVVYIGTQTGSFKSEIIKNSLRKFNSHVFVIVLQELISSMATVHTSRPTFRI